MNKPPSFQFYAKDFYTGTTTLSPAEVGAYIRLLTWSWDNGPVPLDIEKRARIIGADMLDSQRLWEAIADKWDESERGYVNRRIEAERRKQSSFRKLQALNGRKRWDKLASAEPQPETSQAIHAKPAEPMPSSASSSPISDLRSASATADQEPKTPRAKPARSLSTAHDAGFELRFWPAYPRKVAKPKALKAWRKLAPDLDIIGAIVTALDWQCRQPRWLEDRGEYIPHAATWLNDRRWEDEQPSTRRPQMGSAEYYDHATDWVLECKRLHEGKCGSPSAHHTRVILDADKAERAGGAAVTP